MSKQIREAVTEVFSDAQQQICHHHFVNNLGKLIFKEKYVAFRKSIVKMRILSQLKKMKEQIYAMACQASENVLVVAEHKRIALAVEHLLISRELSSNLGIPLFQETRSFEFKFPLRSWITEINANMTSYNLKLNIAIPFVNSITMEA